jgi:hypothetical protein
MRRTESQWREYLDDRMTNRVGWLPRLVMAAYLSIACGCLAYFSFSLHSQEGDRQEAAGRVLNAAMQASAALIYAMLAVVFVFSLAVIASSFSKRRDSIR